MMVRIRKGLATLVSVAALSTGLAVAMTGAASASTPPDSVSLTITPATAVVGDQVTVVATLTNNTTNTVSAALGIQNPQYAAERITGVTGMACATRNLQKLIYCGNPSLLPGATASITVTLIPTAAGTDNFTAYGRITGTNDTLVNGTLTVS